MGTESQAPQSMSLDQAAAQLSAQLAEQTEKPNDEQQVEQETAATEPESHEVADGADVDTDGGGETTEETTTDDASDDAGPSIETLSDLAEALGQPLDDVLANLSTTITVDGEQKQVSLKEMADGYNLSQASQKRMQQVAEEKRQFDAEKQQHRTDLEMQHQILGSVLQQMRNAFIGQIDQALLARLSTEDPAAYAAARIQIDDRVKAFDQLIQQGAQAYGELDQKRSQEDQAKRTTYAQGEREKLIAAIPDWNEAEAKKIGSYLADTYGFQSEQLSSIFDHRELVIARKAMLYDQMQEKAKTATAKVKQLPKLLKSGPKQPGIKVESDALRQAKKRFAQTKSLEDAAKVAALQMK